MDTISASRIALYFCLSSYLPVDLYNFLILSRHLCQYIELLLNDWSITIVTICYFSQYDCNDPLKVTHYWSNDSMSIIKPITLVNDLELEHWAAWKDIPSLWKQGNCFPDGGSFNDVVDVKELICHRRELTVAQNGVFVVVVSGI